MKITIPSFKPVIPHIVTILVTLSVVAYVDHRRDIDYNRNNEIEGVAGLEVKRLTAIALEDNRTYARQINTDLIDEIIMRRGQVKTLNSRVQELERRVDSFESALGRKVRK